MGYIDRLISRLQNCADENEVLNMVRWLEFTTFDIIGDLAFSLPFDCLENNDYHPWVLLLMNFFKAVSYALNAKLFGPLALLLMLFAPIADLKKGKDHVRMAGERVRERLQRGEDPRKPDFWTYVLRANDEKCTHVTTPEMEVNAAVLLPAGTETVATTLCGAIYYLTRSPEVLNRLRHEIDSSFSSERDITMLKTATLPYLSATVQESLRLYSPFAGIPRRQTPVEGGVVSGVPVPGNVS